MQSGRTSRASISSDTPSDTGSAFTSVSNQQQPQQQLQTVYNRHRSRSVVSNTSQATTANTAAAAAAAAAGGGGAAGMRANTPTAAQRMATVQREQQQEEQRQLLYARLQDALERMTTAVLVAQPDEPLPFLVEFLGKYQEEIEEKARKKRDLGMAS